MITQPAQRPVSHAHAPQRTRGRSFAFDSALTFDVTELDLTDNLYFPSGGGIFGPSLTFALAIRNSSHSYNRRRRNFAVCAAFACCARRAPGLPVLCDRKAHISVINALALLGLEPVWFNAGALRA